MITWRGLTPNSSGARLRSKRETRACRSIGWGTRSTAWKTWRCTQGSPTANTPRLRRTPTTGPPTSPFPLCMPGVCSTRCGTPWGRMGSIACGITTVKGSWAPSKNAKGMSTPGAGTSTRASAITGPRGRNTSPSNRSPNLSAGTGKSCCRACWIRY